MDEIQSSDPEPYRPPQREKRPEMYQETINLRKSKLKNGRVPPKNYGQFMGLIFLILLLNTIVFGSWIIVNRIRDPNLFPLSQLVLTGERHYTTHDDIRQSILALGLPLTFMTQDVNIIQKKIEQLPWIKQVYVRKQWPNQLKIHLVEYVPVARWNDLHMLENTGQPFSVPADRMSKNSIPMLYGPKGTEKNVLTNYQTMNKMLVAEKFQLKATSMNACHSWKLTLQEDIFLELGRKYKTERLQRFIMIYPILKEQAKNNNKRITYIDLRYDSGLAVGWAPAFIDSKKTNQ